MKSLSIIVLLIFNSFNLFSQYRKGVVYYNNGDKVTGLIKQQRSIDIKFKLNKKSKVTKLSYKKIKGFDVENKKFRYKYLNSNSSNGKVLGYDSTTGKLIYDTNEKKDNKPKLLELFVEGQINLYGEVFTSSGTPIPGGFGLTFGGGTSVDYYIEKVGNLILVGSRVGNDEMKYFKDCPLLIEKVKNKELQKSNPPSIIHFYNTNCKN